MEFDNDGSFSSQSSTKSLNKSDLTYNTDLERCLRIIQNPVSLRTAEENDWFVKNIMGLDIFTMSVLDNLDAKTVIRKLLPYMQHEFFPANSIISHYDQPQDKMFIILRGQAKEFVPKTLQEMEKEADSLKQRPKSISKSFKSQGPKEVFTLNSLVLNEEDESQITTMNNIKEKAKTMTAIGETFKERYAKINTILPSLKRLVSKKTKSVVFDEGHCEKAMKKMLNLVESLDLDLINERDFLERQIDENILEEFQNYSNNYYLSGILRVKFARFLCAGDHTGLHVLTKNPQGIKAINATEDCHCISIHREDYLKIIEDEKQLNNDKIEFFKKLFGKFDTKAIMKFALLWENQIYQMNQQIFQQGEPSNALYALFSGEVIISRSVEQSRKQKEINEELPLRAVKRAEYGEQSLKVVTVCGGNFFGEEDFLSKSCRHFTATVSSTRAKVFKLSQEKFKIACKDYKEFIVEIENMVSVKQSWKKERIEHLAQQRTTSEPAHEAYDTMLQKKKQLTQLNPLQSKNNTSEFIPKRLKIVEKDKKFNIRLQYDKYFVPKPEKGYPGYVDLFKEEKEKNKYFKDSHKNTKTVSYPTLTSLKSEESRLVTEDFKKDIIHVVRSLDNRHFNTDITQEDESNFKSSKGLYSDYVISSSALVKDSNNHLDLLKVETIKKLENDRILYSKEDYLPKKFFKKKKLSKGIPNLNLDTNNIPAPLINVYPLVTATKARSKPMFETPKQAEIESFRITPLSVRTSQRIGGNSNIMSAGKPTLSKGLPSKSKQKTQLNAGVAIKGVLKGDFQLVSGGLVNEVAIENEGISAWNDGKENVFGVLKNRRGMTPKTKASTNIRVTSMKH